MHTRLIRNNGLYVQTEQVYATLNTSPSFDTESKQKNSPLNYLINPKSNDTYIKLQY